MAKSAGKIHMTRTKELMRAKEQNGPPPPPQKGGSMANFGLLSPYTLPKRRGLMEKSAAHPPPQEVTPIHVGAHLQGDPHPIKPPGK